MREKVSSGSSGPSQGIEERLQVALKKKHILKKKSKDQEFSLCNNINAFILV